MKKIGFIVLFFTLLGSAGCFIIDVESELELVPYINVTLNNDSDENTHMWITDEGISPDNKLEPNGIRKLEYWLKNENFDADGVSEFEDLTVYVGRDGQVLASKTIQVNNLTIFARFFWNGSELTQ